MSEFGPEIHAFLEDAGWHDAQIVALPGDASFRRYFRVRDADRRAMLMHAPPPEENPQQFLAVARWLGDHGLRAPEIYAERPEQGLVLLEDFGNAHLRDWLEAHPEAEEAAYRTAIGTLVELHRQPPGPFDPYDAATYEREVALFTQWYCPALGLSVDAEGYLEAWRETLTPLLASDAPRVTVLRDYHAENIMLINPETGGAEQGLIDFQDALVGHPAYDLVSLLQDARRDVAPGLERAMLAHYAELAGTGAEFAADYARLGAQRNAKIVGIFARLYKRDGKPRYLAMIPRVWEAMERDLLHPALEPVARWFAANIPQDLRDASGGTME